MPPEFDALVERAHALRLKVGPITERPDGQWRVYLQRGTEIFEFAEAPTLVEAFDAAVGRVERWELPQMKPESDAPVEAVGSFLD